MRARAMAFVAASLLRLPAAAAVSSGGEWILEKSAHGILGEPRLAAANNELSQSAGEPLIALIVMSGGGDLLFSGYLSQIPSASTGPRPVLLVSSFTIMAGAALYGVAPVNPLAVTFNTEIDSKTLPGNILVEGVLDRLGNTVSAPQAFSVAWDSAALAAQLTAAWPKGMQFRVIVTSGAKDLNGLPVARGTFTFNSIRDYSLDNVALALDDPATRVRVPALAFGADYFVVVATAVAQTPAVQNATAKLDAAGGERKPVSWLQIDPYNGAAQPANGLAANATLEIPYRDLDGDGRVDGTDIGVKTLSMWRLDEQQQLWVRQGGSIDAGSGQVSLATSHFSIYALIGGLDTDVSSVYAYPVPFRPNAGDVARYGSWATGIRFTNLPSLGEIRIYTVSGTLVRRLDVSSPTQSWDARDEQGQKVASGLYIWEVRSGSNRKTGKLVVIK